MSTTQLPAAPTSPLAFAVGLVLLVGAALPMQWGLLPAVVAFVLALALGWSRLRRRGAIDWAELLAVRLPIVRWAVLGATVFPAIVVGSVCAQGVAAVAVTQPGAVAAIVLVLAAALVGHRFPLPRAAAIALAVIAGLLVPLVAILGARVETDGPESRGWAHSGPIHGIHPFQTTAVVVDGYGPFDLPINDYVEPIGDRGYDPTAFADAMERSLHAIADVHFANGPERARMAFAEATAGAHTTTPVRERLDREPTEATHPRFWVRSGTTGQRSKIEFVCPGRRDDPRGPQPETPMQRMCADKYANEASAGLGVTGRWPGYAEFRGNERVGLSRLFGWTRSDDAIGRARVRWEIRIGAWITLAFAVAIAWRAPPSGTSVVGVLARTLVGLVAIVAIVAAMGATDLGTIPAIARAPAWASVWHLPTWLAALAWPAALGLALWIQPRAPQDSTRRDFVGSRAMVWLLGALAIASTVLLVASDLDATSWAAPDTGGSDRAWPFEAFVVALADRFGAHLGLDILQIEAIVGALVGSVLALACIGILGIVGTAAAVVFRATPSRVPSDAVDVRPRLVVLATAVLCAALVVSRKTEGGSALIPAAMAAAWVLGSTLDEIRRRGPTARTGPSLARATVLVAWVALGVALALQGSVLAALEDPLRLLYGVLGLVAVVLPLVVLLPDRQPLSRPAGPGSSPGDSA